MDVLCPILESRPNDVIIYAEFMSTSNNTLNWVTNTQGGYLFDLVGW